MSHGNRCPPTERRACAVGRVPCWILASLLCACTGGRLSAGSQSGDSLPNPPVAGAAARAGVSAQAASSAGVAPGTANAPASTSKVVEAAPSDAGAAPSPAPVAVSSAAAPVGVSSSVDARAELERLRREAQERLLGWHADGEPRVARELLAPQAAPAMGQFVSIENEAALQHFHRALARLSAGEDEDGKVRILAYGASHTQADIYPGYLRAYLQGRFGDGGQGFVLPGRVNRWPQSRSMPGWQRSFAVHHARYRRDVRDEPLGLFGAALVGRRGGAVAELAVPKDSANTRFELQYFEDVGGGDFALQVDGVTIAEIATSSAAPRTAFRAFVTSPGAHKISVRLKGNGPVRLFGVVAETDTPGVVVDTLGISGAHIASNLAWQENAWIEAVRRRNPDLVTFAYGTNESADASLTVAAYELQLAAVLTRLRRAAPETSCVLIAPFDGPKRLRSRLMKILEVQRRVSADYGCGFWDGYAFMGGEGSMRRWVHAHPPLAHPDHIHLTHLGYVHVGVAIGDALLRAYDVDTDHSSVTARSGAPSLGLSSAALPAPCDPALCP